MKQISTAARLSTILLWLLSVNTGGAFTVEPAVQQAGRGASLSHRRMTLLAMSTVSRDWLGSSSSSTMDDRSPSPFVTGDSSATASTEAQQQQQRRKLRMPSTRSTEAAAQNPPVVSPELELPSKHFTAAPPPEETFAMTVEMTLGRVAMVTAVVLFVTELTTGQSLPEQIMAAFLVQ